MEETVVYGIVRYNNDGSWAIIEDGFTSYDEVIWFILESSRDYSDCEIRAFCSL